MAFEQRNLDDYVDVATRIADFRERYPEGTLQPASLAEPWRWVQIQGFDKGGDVVTQTFIVYVAAAYRHPLDEQPGIGCAWEVFPGRTPYTRGSELQNAETSAWGRAIIAVGASDARRGIASREEIRNRQEEDPAAELIEQARAMRRKDPEVDAHGAATVAEQTRMMTGPEPGTWRLAATPADDPWYVRSDAAPVSLPPRPIGESTEDQPGTVIREQLNRMHALFGKLGVTDRQERLKITRETLGIDMLASSARLSFRQGQALVAALEQLAASEAAAK
jgi:hypothetical protein